MAALMRALKPAKAVPSPPVKDDEPAKRFWHSTVVAGDCLYMWGGGRDDHPKEHNIEIERRDSSVVEVLHLLTGRWEQKPTTGNPPLGTSDYAAVAIGNEIFYYGGHCSHWDYDDNALYSLNVDTLKWRKVVPKNSEDGPKEKKECSMIAVKIEGEDYLVIIEPGSNCIYYFRVAAGNSSRIFKIAGQWIVPKVTGDDITEIGDTCMISVDDTSALLQIESSAYRLTFTKGSVVCTNIHVSLHASTFYKKVLLDPFELKLLAIGDDTCMTFDVNETAFNWKEVSVPNVVKNRTYHSLSVWNESITNTWIIMFGGDPYVGDDTKISETVFLNISYNKDGDVSARPCTLSQYQEERRRQEISQKGERERIMEERHQQEIQQLHLQMEERDQQARERERGLERQLQEMERKLREKERKLQEMQRELQEREKQLQGQFQERERQQKRTGQTDI